MKSLKKFFLTMAVAMVFSTSAFAASGFEFLLNVPFGLGVDFPNAEAKKMDMGASLGVDVGVDAQIGYMFQVVDRFGISLLAELGYSWDWYALDANKSSDLTTFNLGYSISMSYHNFKLGLLPKFNIGFGGRHGLAIGIGGGVKIPISGKLKLTYRNWDEINNTLDENDIINGKLDRKDISDMFSPSVIGYMKVTFDYYLFFTDNIAMNFGLYLGGDFGMKTKEGILLPSFGKIGGDAFNFGLQLGFRFGPKA